MRLPIINKIKLKTSTTGQILGDFFSNEIENYKTKVSNKKSWSGKSIRELTQDVYQEKSYDIGYWMLSIFTHGSALSIAHESKIKKYQRDKLLNIVFDTNSKEGMAWSFVLKYPPISLLNVFRKVDKFLELGQSSKIDEAWKSYQAVLGKLYNNQIQIVEEGTIMEGDVIIVAKNEEKIYKKVYKSKDYLRKEQEKK